MSTLRACDLRPNVVYVSPRGLLVRLLPSTALRGIGSAHDCYYFAYVARPANRRGSEPDGFALTERNVCILRPGVKL